MLNDTKGHRKQLSCISEELLSLAVESRIEIKASQMGNFSETFKRQAWIYLKDLKR